MYKLLEFNGIEILYLILFFFVIALGLLYEISRNLINFYDYHKFA